MEQPQILILRTVALGLALFCLAGCSRNSPTSQVPAPQPIAIEETATEAIDAADPDVTGDVKANAVTDLNGQTYQDVRGTSGCTSDCSGHDAGFAWAQENEITDPDNCDGNSDSFIEGCRAYGEEIAARTDEGSTDVDSTDE